MQGAVWSEPVGGVLLFQDVLYLWNAKLVKERSSVEGRWFVLYGKKVWRPGRLRRV